MPRNSGFKVLSRDSAPRKLLGNFINARKIILCLVLATKQMLDFYRKTHEDLVKQTTQGAVLSICAGCVVDTVARLLWFAASSWKGVWPGLHVGYRSSFSPASWLQ